MDFLEPLGELLFEIIIPWFVMVPGSFIRWIIAKISGKKKTYREFYQAGGFLTGICGILFYVGLFVWII
ncbi:MAG: hypothetical protein ACI8ZM_002643 [Crocinitomix sp.]|jgi:hypothetical protein